MCLFKVFTKYLFKLFLILVLFTIISCEKGTEPDNESKKPALNRYIPLNVGNAWTYEVKTRSYGGFISGRIFDGVEIWKIISISNDTTSFKIECVFNGFSYDYDDSFYYDSTAYTDLINYLDIIFVNNSSSEFPSQSIKLQKCDSCASSTILKTLLEQEIVNEYNYLEVVFPPESDSLLIRSPNPITLNDGVSTTLKIDYIIKKGLGIIELKTYNYDTADHGFNISYKLIDHQIYD
jgi:hypothetical protein